MSTDVDDQARALQSAAKRVSFRLNSGRRTMRQQAALLAQNMVRPGVAKPGRPLTSVPNPNAPHSMVGRPNHSLDVDTEVADGGEDLERELERMGLVIINDVAGEPWHQTERDARRPNRSERNRRQRDVDAA